jgi:iron complex transport system substrate-binding protein
MRSFLLFLLVVAACGPACAETAITVRDDAGRQVGLAAPARRIVSLAPHLTELLFAAGAGAQIVAVSEHSSYPPQARGLPRVGGGAGLDLEAIVALQPDLVVAWQSGNSPGQLAQLERSGLVLFRSEPGRIETIATSLERLGTLAGTAQRAAQAARAFRAGVASLESRYLGRPGVRVFYQIWETPLMTINGKHIISAWLRLCGAQNVFGDMPALAGAVSLEAVLAKDPQVIVAGRYAGKGDAWKQRWRAWPQLRATSKRRLYTVPAEMMERHTPRALIAAQELCVYIEQARDD